MKRLLLIGAGFSKNWGAPLASEFFDHLLTFPAVGDRRSLKRLLMESQEQGGFEHALSQLQSRSDPDSAMDRTVLENALDLLFQRVNRLFFNAPRFEFQQHRRWTVRDFLGRFDAIFTLNQDVLLEHHYARHVDLLGSPRGWTHVALPGMRPTVPIGDELDRTWGMYVWVPGDDPAQGDPHGQPIYKLHGSTNWRTQEAGGLMVLGGAKEHAIQRHPTLARYFSTFRESLRDGGARLCVVGYGFGDAHINREIENAMLDTGLGVFLVDPAGEEAYRRANPTYRSEALIKAKSRLDEAFAVGLAGVCRAPLREVFGGANLHHENLLAFVEP
jgi:hypothetical protein